MARNAPRFDSQWGRGRPGPYYHGGNVEAKSLTRPEEILRAFSDRHPGIWQFFARCRSDYRDWPDWCYVPVSAAHQYIGQAHGVDVETLQIDPAYMPLFYDASIASMLAAWRMGRGIYRFDATLAEALAATPLTGGIPTEIFMHIPEWAVYVETTIPSEIRGFPSEIRGFFAVLDWMRSGDHEIEMRIFLDYGDPMLQLIPIPLVGQATIGDVLEFLRSRVRNNAKLKGFDAEGIMGVFFDGAMTSILTDIAPVVLNLLLYICSPEAEYKGGVRPERPAAIKTKRGERLFPASSPRVWRIGETIGARLRQARTTAPNLPDERNAPRPHLRRAHWHTYRTGPGRQNYIVRWLHPILVGYGDDDSAV